jgi:hypothetical protein
MQCFKVLACELASADSGGGEGDVKGWKCAGWQWIVAFDVLIIAVLVVVIVVVLIIINVIVNVVVSVIIVIGHCHH